MADEKQNPVQQYQPPEGTQGAAPQQTGFDPAQTFPSPPSSQPAVDESPSQFSSVAAGVTGNRKLFLLIFGGVAAGILLFSFLPSGTDPVQQQRIDQKQKLEERATQIVKESKPIAAPVESVTATVAPTITQPPPVAAPQPPEPPPAPAPIAPTAPSFPTDSTPSAPSFVPEGTAPSKGVFSNDEAERKRLAAIDSRRKSGIMVTGSGKGGLDALTGESGAKKDGKEGEKASDTGKDAKKKSTDNYLGFGDGSLNEQALAKTSSSQVKATYIGKLDNTIAQGKIIDAVLETSINTDLAGTLRAIVTRDVYAESGKAVLIPKGSRLIGKYTTESKPGQTRINVTWDRLIRPDGIDLALGSPGTDTLGRAGVAGFVDDKLTTKLTAAFLISYIIPAIINKISNIKDQATTNTTTSNSATGTTTSSSTGGSTKGDQLKESADKFKELTQKSIEEAFNTTTTIYVDQGTRINVFVNQDLVFPAQITSAAMGVVR